MMGGQSQLMAMSVVYVAANGQLRNLGGVVTLCISGTLVSVI
jgi:hypothetical protein